jgi:secreted PhoX family phosphatase
MNQRTLKRRAAAIAALAISATAIAMTANANAGVDDLGFTPITTNALPCTANGYIQFAANSKGVALTPTVLMSAGDAATPVNAPATSTAVGRVNDMIAISPNGKYLYTVSENGFPTENKIGADGSDGLTRLTLKGPDAGTKVILADNVSATGTPLWQRIDGIKWYPYGGPDGEGTLLASEEFLTGGIWQINPKTGAFTRLDWLGNYSHEGIGLDKAGNLYLGNEDRDKGAIYKAVPNNKADLTQGGTLYFMVGTDVDPSGWKQVVDPANAAVEASTGKGLLFDRPEDFDERNGRVYFTVTEPAGDSNPRHGLAGQVVNRGGVYSLNTVGVPDLAIQSGAGTYNYLTPMIEVNDPTYATQADAQAQQGLQFPDNIAFDDEGNLWVHEDIPDGGKATGVDVTKQARNQQDELYVYKLNLKGDAIKPNKDTTGPGISGGYKAADMRTSPGAKSCENEFTGGIFRGKTLYINQQHYDNPTLTVTFG